jgi:hypothetical protein
MSKRSKRKKAAKSRKQRSQCSKPVLQLSWDAFKQIAETIGQHPAETGGVFGGPEAEERITSFHFDNSARISSVTYSPDHVFLNHLFKEHWNPSGLRLKGFVHSHPGRSCTPSGGDEIYAANILKAIKDLGMLWLPIVNTIPDTGAFTITPWVAKMQGERLTVIRASIRIIGIPDRMVPRLFGQDMRPMLSGTIPLDHIHIVPSATLATKGSREINEDSECPCPTCGGTGRVCKAHRAIRLQAMKPRTNFRKPSTKLQPTTHHETVH